MNRRRSSSLVVALILILLGLWFLALELLPGLSAWVHGALGWPLIVVAVGVGLLLIGLVTDAPGMAVPACIVAGIGALLYWQNATGHWESWAYAWALIPGFGGVGTMLMGLWQGRWSEVRAGAWTVLVSLVLFAVFGAFLGGLDIFGPYWPALLIALGLLLLLRALVAPGRQPARPPAVDASTPPAEPPLPPALQGES
jgi:hypothetical protein